MTQQSLIENTYHDAGGKVKLPVPKHWKSDAVWSGDNREYRDVLRYWWSAGPVLLGALMNPSVATPEQLDPTLAKFGRLAEKWGYGGFTIVNACNYRCTDSKLLRTIARPWSISNTPACRKAAGQASKIIVGYGKLHPSLQNYADAMVRALRHWGDPLYVLGLNKDGSPKHPLYIREDTKPMEWLPAVGQ